MVTIILIYLLSVGLNFVYLKIAYSKTGRWSNLKMIQSDWILILFPVFNTFFCLIGWFCFNPKRKLI